MIIVCDSCGTRFHLADGRVGPKGAKVRCSNCHHSFQVTPPPKDAQERPPRGEHSPRAAKPERVDREASRSRKVLGDPDLDNPKFLFEGGPEDAEAPTGGTTVPDGVPFAAGETTQMHQALAGEDDPTPPGRHEPTPLMGLDPEVSARQQRLIRDLAMSAADPAPARAEPDAAQNLFDFGRQDDYELTPVPGREPNLSAKSEPSLPQSPPSAGEPDPDSEPDTLMRLAAEEVDEAISRWDAPVSPPPSARRVEVLRPKAAPAAARPLPRSAERSAPSHESEIVPATAAEPETTPIWLHALVALVAIGLVATGVRASLRQVAAPDPASLEIRALGWTAVVVRARPARDAAGDATIEVEGALRGPGDAAFPRVRVSMLDGAGRPIGSGVDARIDASGSFLAALAEPPATASAFRVELSATVELPAPPAQTTTASPAPVPESPAPAQPAVPESAPAAPF